MRVCFFTSANSLQGGAELCMALIVKHLLDTGHEPHVVLPQRSELTEHYEAMGAKVHVLYWQHLRTLAQPLHVLKYLFFLPVVTLRLARLLRREKIDLLHVNEILDFQGLAAARLAHVPAVTHVRVILPNPIMRRALAGIATCLARKVVCVSKAVHRMALRGTPNPKVRVIYDGGPDLTAFDPRIKPERPAEAGDALVIGMVAKYIRWKGHLALLELAGRLTEMGYAGIHYVIVGGEVAGHEQYAQEIRDQIAARGLSGRVHLVGQRRDVAPFIAGMDIVCHLPLWEDPFPGVPLEMAAMAKPLLSFISGGVPEQLTSPDSARLVPIGDMDALAQNAKELIDDPDLRQRMGQRAAQEIRAKFSLAGHFAQLDALYQELTGGKARP